MAKWSFFVTLFSLNNSFYIFLGFFFISSFLSFTTTNHIKKYLEKDINQERKRERRQQCKHSLKRNILWFNRHFSFVSLYRVYIYSLKYVYFLFCVNEDTEVQREGKKVPRKMPGLIYLIWASVCMERVGHWKPFNIVQCSFPEMTAEDPGSEWTTLLSTVPAIFALGQGPQNRVGF